MKSELGIGFEASQRVANAYLLTLAGLILFGGSVGDTFGQRRTFILGLSGIRRPRRTAAAALDFLSTILGVLCLGSMSYGLIEAGTGASLRGASFVLLALPLGALLVWRERRACHPVVPPRLFRDRRFVAANAMTVVLHASLTGSLFLLPFLLIYTYRYSAAAARAAFLPFSAIMAVGSRTAGGLALRIGSRAMLVVGSLVTIR